MAEVKNSFLKSKMNKDLDDRLIPNGEYRHATNISVGRSEDSDVGALENILGNALVPNSGEGVNMTCIGTFEDDNNNRLYRFLTDYVDAKPNDTPHLVSSTANCKIVVTDFNNGPASTITLVEGSFLNFAKNKGFEVIGVNLVEDLLYWTDNRNQPRKINVSLANPNSVANPTFYTTEEQISVAKFAPINPAELVKKMDVIVVADTVDLNTFKISPQVTDNSRPWPIEPGMVVVSDSQQGNIPACNFTTVVSYDEVSGLVTMSDSYTLKVDDVITLMISTMTNQSADPTWPGDPDYLENRYVRFSYRFKYVDKEYSTFAPFTQICFIPKQKGYFIRGDEQSAYRSTIVDWFENNVNNIELIFRLPTTGDSLYDKYKITEIDILYKESDAVAVKVLKSIPVSTIATSADKTNLYTYTYQSQKPYKTLPQRQTTRVYDKVPVRARSQEVSGNRVIYGNYIEGWTPPSAIDYKLAVQDKGQNFDNFVEYPNHTLKQNRNYQVGFILSDKYNRQSSVILSVGDTVGVDAGGALFGDSTVFSSYSTAADPEVVKCWFGNAIRVLVDSPISSSSATDGNGAPGLYANPTGLGTGFEITDASINTNQYSFNFNTSFNNQFPSIGDYMRGQFQDYVEITNINIGNNTGVITTDGPVNISYLKDLTQPSGIPQIRYGYVINQAGWYSYKVVVRQQEQDYYNTYLPGILKGYPIDQTYGAETTYSIDSTIPTDPIVLPVLANGINTTDFPVGELGKTSHAVLINDNINKVPRDLEEVGPDQTQYRSAVELFGRVENFGQTVDLNLTNGYDQPSTSGKYDFIDYVLATVPDSVINIEPGDGVEALDGAGNNQGDTSYPDSWLRDTVVVSNDPNYDTVNGIGRIKFRPEQIVYASGGGSTPNTSWRFTRQENKQYFPGKKADTVSTIASSLDLGFLSNDVENVRGTSALNLYQLETNPLVARISTEKSIGAEGQLMVPFLSVYETAPVESLLDIFWETGGPAGLISDLNFDVNTGYDGPIGFTDTAYSHFENQDYQGTGTATGAVDSKYITNVFRVINQTGTQLVTTINSFSVTDVNGNDLTSNFNYDDSYGGINGDIRLFIENSDFNFTSDSAVNDNYTFTFNVSYESFTVDLSTTGRLSNVVPEIYPACQTLDTSISLNHGSATILTMTGNNGSYTADINNPSSNNLTGLHWSIVSGDPAFQINASTGEISLTAAAVISPPAPNLYCLNIKLTDAWNYSNNTPTSGNTDPNFNSMDVSCSDVAADVCITVGQEEVPVDLQDVFDQVLEGELYNLMGVGPDNGCTGGGQAVQVKQASYNVNIQNLPYTVPAGGNSYPYKYGCIYIGRDLLGTNGTINASSTAADGIGTLPNSTNGGGQSYTFMSGVNLSQSLASSVDPVALTSGQLEFVITLINAQVVGGGCTTTNPGAGLFGCCQGLLSDSLKWKVYYRAESTTTPNPNNWTAVPDAYATTAGFHDNVDGNLSTTVIVGGSASGAQGGTPDTNYASTAMLLDGSANPGEYCVVLELKADSMSGANGVTYNDNGGGTGAYPSISIRDANYDYPNGPGNGGVLRGTSALFTGASAGVKFVRQGGATGGGGVCEPQGLPVASQAYYPQPISDTLVAYDANTQIATFQTGNDNANGIFLVQGQEVETPFASGTQKLEIEAVDQNSDYKQVKITPALCQTGNVSNNNCVAPTSFPISGFNFKNGNTIPTFCGTYPSNNAGMVFTPTIALEGQAGLAFFNNDTNTSSFQPPYANMYYNLKQSISNFNFVDPSYDYGQSTTYWNDFLVNTISFKLDANGNTVGAPEWLRSPAYTGKWQGYLKITTGCGSVGPTQGGNCN